LRRRAVFLRRVVFFAAFFTLLRRRVVFFAARFLVVRFRATFFAALRRFLAAINYVYVFVE